MAFGPTWGATGLDMEHGDMSYGQLAEMTAAARISGMDVVLRIAKGGYSNILKALAHSTRLFISQNLKSRILDIAV